MDKAEDGVYPVSTVFSFPSANGAEQNQLESPNLNIYRKSRNLSSCRSADQWLMLWFTQVWLYSQCVLQLVFIIIVQDNDGYGEIVHVLPEKIDLRHEILRRYDGMRHVPAGHDSHMVTGHRQHDQFFHLSHGRVSFISERSTAIVERVNTKALWMPSNWMTLGQQHDIRSSPYVCRGRQCELTAMHRLS